MDCFDFDIINRYILNKHYLGAVTAPEDISELIQSIGGLPAATSFTPYLSLFARKPDFKRDQLDKILYDQATIAKIRGPRREMFILPANQIPKVYQATADKSQKASRGLLFQQGLSATTYTQLSTEILALLADKSMTKEQIKDELAIEEDVSAILNMMCDECLILRGRPASGWLDENIYFARFGDVFPDLNLQGVSEKEAISQLVHFYLRSYGPATENDISWWTGLGKIRIRAALRTLGELVSQLRACGSNQRFLILSEELPYLQQTPNLKEGITLRFLPHLDPYFMGYIDRDRYSDMEEYDRIFDLEGRVTNTLLVNGDIKGVWDIDGGDPPLLKFHLFDYYLPIASDALIAQAKGLGQFLFGEESKVVQCPYMPELRTAPPGRFQTPLVECR